jgi:hypothetical protein
MTIIQVPIRLHRRIYTSEKRGIGLDLVGGFSYLYNWNVGVYGSTTISRINLVYDYIGLKRNIFWLDYGLQVHKTDGRLRFYAFYYFNKAFSDLAKAKGTYSPNQVNRYEIESIVRGNAINIGLGVQYGIYLPSYTERQSQRKKKRETKIFEKLNPLDPYRTLTQFTKQDRLALMVGSPLFFTQDPSTQTGAGSMSIASAPGLMIGLDYYQNYNAKWALHTGLRVGQMQAIYTHSIEGESIQIPVDLSATYPAWQWIFNVPIGIMRRFPISQKQAFHVETGLNLYTVYSDNMVYFQSENPEFNGRNNADLIVDYNSEAAVLSATPYLQVGFGTLLKKGNMLQIDFLAQPSISRLMRTEYGFYNNRTQDPNPVGEGTFTSGNGAIALQVSYVFNNLKRQRRKNDLD